MEPGGRVRRAQTAEDGKFSKNFFFSKVEEFSRMRRSGARGTCAQRPDRGRWKIFKKKFFSEKSKNTRACARVVPGGRVRRAQTAEDEKILEKKFFFRKVEKYSRVRTSGARGTCAQGPDRGRWKIFKKKIFSEKSKNTRACAGVAPGGRVRRAQTAEDEKKFRKFFFRKVEK